MGLTSRNILCMGLAVGLATSLIAAPATGSVAHPVTTHHVKDSLIAFERSTHYDAHGRPHSEAIMLMHPNGSHVRRLLSDCSSPVFMASGSMLSCFHRFNLLTITLNRRHRQSVISTSDVLGRPSFSPDGSMLVAVDYTQDFLFTFSLRDHQIQVFRNSAGLNYPAFSPDGREIIADRWDPSLHSPIRSFIIMMRIDGSHRRTVPHSVGGAEPAFSPDGRWILFTRGLNHPGPQLSFERYGLFVMRANGTHRHRLGRFSTVDTPAASYSPDGQFIVFNLRRSPEGRDNIAAIHADGSRLSQLTHGGLNTDNRDPSWQPIS